MPSKPRIALLLILLPLLVSAQQQTPAEAAEVALRARVTEFLQYHVEGNFRKAYDLVADDTKEEYFNTAKAQLKGFTIDAVKLSDDLTKATVTATMSKTMVIIGQEIPTTVPSTTTWKIENGKWVWYNDVKRVGGTPMDPLVARGPAPAGPRSTDNAAAVLPDEKAIAAAAESIQRQTSVDRKEVTLAADKPSEGKVVFHNGMTGSVQLELNAPEIPGFTAKLEQSNARAGADVPVVFRYEPANAGTRRDPITVQLVVQPLNQAFAIRVNFAPADSVKSK